VTRTRHGFVAAEFVACMALLLVPTVMLVATVPEWAARRHAAIVVAREAATYAADRWPADSSRAAADVGTVIAANYGLPTRDVDVAVVAETERGGQVTGIARVRMPAISIFGITSVGAWTWTAEHRRRIDDYRSR
jgi:hypothetical protein